MTPRVRAPVPVVVPATSWAEIQIRLFEVWVDDASVDANYLSVGGTSGAARRRRA